MRFSTAITVLAGAGLISAQSISDECSSTLQDLVESSAGACIDSSGVIPILISSYSNTSVIAPVTSWVSVFCSTAICSNDTLSQIVQNVTTGCSSDLASAGLPVTPDEAGSIVTLVQQIYPATRNMLCLKDTSNNTNCVVETLSNLQSSIGTITLNTVMPLLMRMMLGGMDAIPASVLCTDCNKQAFNIAGQTFPSFSSTVYSSAQSQCGQNWTDGQAPTDIQETATNSTGNGSLLSGASSMAAAARSASGATVVALLLISSLFVFAA